MQEHSIRKGLDLPLAGAPFQEIEIAAPATHVAILGADHLGLKPRMIVSEGDSVMLGQPVVEDKAVPGLTLNAPAGGRVTAINRGDKRAFQSLVIEVDEAKGTDRAQVAFGAFAQTPIADLDADNVTALLVESGLWWALRTRPFSHVPVPGTAPLAIFVTAMDTRPHAPYVDTVLADRMEDFAAGVLALSRLTEGVTYVCTAPGSAVTVPDAPGIEHATFAGPHPAGNVGTHIHFICPADLQRQVWHAGYQDVAAIGHLFRTGALDTTRVVSIAGPGAARPRLLRTRMGAALDPLLVGELRDGPQRVVSGSVLDGRAAAGSVHGYLGRFSNQIAILPEAVEREAFGWIRPGGQKFSIWGVVTSAFRKTGGLKLTTTTNGGYRAMVPIGSFERVMPLDLMPTFLLRALLMQNIERATALGALELDEEDLALCTFVCPGKAEYGPLLREALQTIRKEEAA